MATEAAMRKQDLAHRKGVEEKLDAILERLGQLEELLLSLADSGSSQPKRRTRSSK